MLEPTPRIAKWEVKDGAPAAASLAGQPSSLDGLDHTNCGPQVLIAAITVTAIHDVLRTRNADHV